MNKLAKTITELLSASPQSIVSTSRAYTPELIKSINNRWIYRVGDYTVRIRIPKIAQSMKRGLRKKDIKELQKIDDRDVFVSCNCKFWKWNGPDYNAHNEGYSERTYSNLSSPEIRDPNGQFLICKHVYAALKDFLSNFDIVD